MGPRGREDGQEYELYDMTADPAQEMDIADQQPERTRRLASAYETWYREVTSGGTDPPPLPVGYSATDPVALQAEDSKLQGGLQFRRKQGWAHDSVLNWRSSNDSMTWNIDMMQSGRYEVLLMIGCAAVDMGSKASISPKAATTISTGSTRVPPSNMKRYSPR